MDTKILEYIIAIAEEKSVTRASERFLLSHQALYRHVKNIEAELGTPIFRRTHGGVQLTPAGVIFVTDAQAILRAEQELVNRLDSLRREKNKSLRVVVDSHLQNRFLKRISPRFQQAFPDYILEVTSGNAAEARRALLDRHADLGVFDSTSPQDRDLEYLAFSSLNLLPAFPLQFTGPLNAAGLKAAVEQGMFIILFPTGTTARSMEEAQLNANRIYPTRILEAGVQTSITHILDGQTCGLLPDVFCTDELRSRIRIGEPLYKVYNVIAYSRDAVPVGAAKTLMQIIMDEFPR